MKIVLMILGASIGMAWAATGTVAPGNCEEKRKLQLTLGELRDDVIVYGRLGIPLAQVATIRGTWRSKPHKDRELLFVVTHVDGKQLEMEVTFSMVSHNGRFRLAGDRYRKGDDQPTHGVEWEMRGWEMIRSVGVPPSVNDEIIDQLNGDEGSPIPSGHGEILGPYKLTTDLNFWSQAVIR